MSGHPERELLFQDRQDPRRRAQLLLHLEGCAECRARLAAEDPTRLFALLALSRPPAALLEALSRHVDSEVSAVEEGRPARRRAYGFASLAASLMLSGLFGTYLWTRQAVLPGPRAQGPQRDVVEAVPAAGGRSPGAAIELISSPGEAEIHHLSIGDTQLTMIFDKALDI